MEKAKKTFSIPKITQTLKNLPSSRSTFGTSQTIHIISLRSSIAWAFHRAWCRVSWIFSNFWPVRSYISGISHRTFFQISVWIIRWISNVSYLIISDVRIWISRFYHRLVAGISICISYSRTVIIIINHILISNPIIIRTNSIRFSIQHGYISCRFPTIIKIRTVYVVFININIFIFRTNVIMYNIIGRSIILEIYNWAYAFIIFFFVRYKNPRSKNSFQLIKSPLINSFNFSILYFTTRHAQFDKFT